MDKSLTPDEKQALKEFHQRLRTHFKKRLKDCRLFGSKARGDDSGESDLDVLVLIEKMSYKDKRWAITCGADISLEYLVEVSPLCMNPKKFEELRQRERRLALDIEREGIHL